MRNVSSVRWPNILLDLGRRRRSSKGGSSRDGGSDGTLPLAADRKPPKVISPSDPSSARTAKANKRVQFGYGLDDLTDVEHAVIVDVETNARAHR
jgi:hypothetical protein